MYRIQQLPEVQSPVPYLTATTRKWHSQRPWWQDWLWAMFTYKVYGFDTELTLLKCLTDLSGEGYKLMVL